MPVCKHVHYSGDVQGVGFRYTAQRLAQRFPVAGFVRNLPDGRVELLAEGETGDVDGYLGALGRQMAEYITEQDVAEEPVQGVKGFSVRQ